MVHLEQEREIEEAERENKKLSVFIGLTTGYILTN